MSSLKGKPSMPPRFFTEASHVALRPAATSASRAAWPPALERKSARVMTALGGGGGAEDVAMSDMESTAFNINSARNDGGSACHACQHAARWQAAC